MARWRETAKQAPGTAEPDPKGQAEREHFQKKWAPLFWFGNATHLKIRGRFCGTKWSKSSRPPFLKPWWFESLGLHRWGLAIELGKRAIDA